MGPLEILALAEGLFNLYLKAAEMASMSEDERAEWEAEQRAKFKERGPETL